MRTATTFITDKVTDLLVKRGGVLVSDAVYKRRETVCRSCPNFGTVEPITGIKIEGCTLCGCPLATKARFKSVMRKAEDLGRPLTAKELLIGGGLHREKIKCPNPELDLWHFS